MLQGIFVVANVLNAFLFLITIVVKGNSFEQESSGCLSLMALFTLLSGLFFTVPLIPGVVMSPIAITVMSFWHLLCVLAWFTLLGASYVQDTPFMLNGAKIMVVINTASIFFVLMTV